MINARRLIMPFVQLSNLLPSFSFIFQLAFYTILQIEILALFPDFHYTFFSQTHSHNRRKLCLYI